jgi:hypothetical protein
LIYYCLELVLIHLLLRCLTQFLVHCLQLQCLLLYSLPPINIKHLLINLTISLSLLINSLLCISYLHTQSILNATSQLNNLSLSYSSPCLLPTFVSNDLSLPSSSWSHSNSNAGALSNHSIISSIYCKFIPLYLSLKNN